MNLQFYTVLVESYINGNVYGNSGIMINNRYIITTFNAISPLIENINTTNIEDLKKSIRSYKELISKTPFFVNFKCKKKLFNHSNAYFLDLFWSENINQSAKSIFRNWSIDSPFNSSCELVSLFLILKLDVLSNEFSNDIHNWFKAITKSQLRKGQDLSCISVGFGNKNFLDNYSRGIVSNILGLDNCLVFSDLPLTPGSEGSPIFCDDLCQVPVGIVISTINWWKYEWLNLTVLADLRPLMIEILQSSVPVAFKPTITYNNFKLLSTLESCIFQIYNGSVWGSAVLINEEKGILLTNAHVIGTTRNSFTLYKKAISYQCDVVYSNSVENSIDIAVLKMKTNLDNFGQAISLSRKTLMCGDIVYAAGFPIFPKETNTGATLTKGYISHIHPHMIKTSCSVYPGSSGGAILDDEGCLIAIIVCNAKTSEPVNIVYPRVNMNIPIKLIEPILSNYMEKGDVKILEEMDSIDAKIWNFSNKL